MKHPVIVCRPRERHSYQVRQKNLLTRFIAASALVHLLVLALPGWSPSVSRIPAVPSIQISLQQAPASKPIDTVVAENRARLPSAVPSPAATKPNQARTQTAEAVAAASELPGETERLNHLQTLLRGALEQQFVYPPLARRHGWQGKVELTAEVDTDGRLQNMRVLHSSGYTILDHDALATLTRIGELPQARAWLLGRGYRFALPVVYRLVEG